MSERTESRAKDDVAAYRAVELIYHSYLTGLILMLSSRAGPARPRRWCSAPSGVSNSPGSFRE